MTSLFDRIKAMNSNGPFLADRVGKDAALAGGRHPVLEETQPHALLNSSLGGAKDFQDVCPGAEEIVLGAGCFWGVEKFYWDIDGVLSTSVGYAGGWTANPTYREVCTGRTDHAEVVRVVFDPSRVDVAELLRVMFENHDPTLGDRQGNDVGSQYRSCVYATTRAQLDKAKAAVKAWEPRFEEAGRGAITTEVAMLSDAGNGHYYLAEEEHQQYLYKNPGGYCNHGPHGVSCPTGVLEG